MNVAGETLKSLGVSSRHGELLDHFGFRIQTEKLVATCAEGSPNSALGDDVLWGW